MSCSSLIFSARVGVHNAQERFPFLVLASTFVTPSFTMPYDSYLLRIPPEPLAIRLEVGRLNHLKQPIEPSS